MLLKSQHHGGMITLPRSHKLLAIGELNSDGVIGTPAHAAFMGATVAWSDAQQEFVRHGGRLYTDNFCATIGKIPHYATTGHTAVQVVDRCR